jgi:Ribonuclease G/E
VLECADVKVTLCIDDAVGEHRRALLDPFGKPFRLEIERWSERGRRAKLDEIWWGRVTARMPGGRGWFVDLGLAQSGVIEPSKAQAIVEGAMLPLRVKSEAWVGKGAVLSLADMSPDAPRPQAPQRHAPPADDPFLRGVEVIATVKDQPARKRVDAAIEEALERSVPIACGGDIAIEATRALTAIDVDAGERDGILDAEAYALDLNIAATEEAARQIALRGIGGLVAIDYLSLQQRRHRKQVTDALRDALAGWLGRASRVLEMSELGVCEAAIARRMRPVRDALAIPAEEREALDALREIEGAGWTARGGRIQARLSAKAIEWLDANPNLSKALNDRIGARWTVEVEERPPGRPQVWSA